NYYLFVILEFNFTPCHYQAGKLFMAFYYAAHNATLTNVADSKNGFFLFRLRISLISTKWLL
ncbi:hypothetical protein, partial [Cronobacter dublinensis]|uniref:hypothetical protein n=1 Tax=Cronobacter dublinensis TaxID=413497 RepID=UPI001F2CE469